MHKYLLLLFTLITTVAVNSQNVMSSSDQNYGYNSTKPLGNPANPVDPPAGVIAKWVHDTISSRIFWNDNAYKCYIWNGMAYRLRFPNNYDPNYAAKYPLMLFFHGAGEIKPVHDNEDHLYWGASSFQDIVNSGSWNGFILFPQQHTAGDEWSDSYFTLVNGVLDTLEKYNGFDPNRLVTMGLSEGGEGALEMTRLYPKRVSTCIPSSPVRIKFPDFNHLQVPIWLADGGNDNNPDPGSTTGFADSLRSIGGDCVQQYYYNLGHGIWTNHWAQLDITNTPILYGYLNNTYKAQPVLYFGKNLFCQGSAISAKMGLTAGFYAYQWQRDGGAGFADIAGASGNEYTATQTGTYRARIKRTVSSDWSAWSPNPIKIATKPCSLDTVFTEHFTYNTATIVNPSGYDYQYNAPNTEYKRYNWTCQNGLYSTGADNITQDAAGTPGGRMSLYYTNSSSGSCVYSATDRVWGMYQNQPTVKWNTNYLFSFYAANLSTTSPRAALSAVINGSAPTLLSKPTTLPSSVSGNKSWTKFTYLWNSNFSSSADLSIVNATTSTSGNDFAIDEISLTRLLAPGGFVNNMALWAKADALPLMDSTRLPDWSNATGGTELVQTGNGNKPLLRNNSADNINFNPLVSFNTANDRYLTATTGFAGTTAHTAAHVFMVARANNNTLNDSVMIERQASGGRVAVGMPNAGNIIWDAGSTGSGNRLTTPMTNAEVNKAFLWSFSKDNVHGTGTSAANQMDIRKNGVVVASSGTASPSFTGNSSDFKIGSSDVRVAELIYYLDANINAARQNRIESYLATKYGMTLGTTAAPVSYIASDSATTFWTGSATYQNDVFGIGVDSASGLNQLISNSMNSGSGDGAGQSAKGNLIVTAIAPVNDLRFLMMGNDAAVLTEHTIIPGEAPAGLQTAKRVGREWKVKNTNGVGAVTVAFDTTGLTLAGGSVAGNFALLIDSDGDGNFNTGTASLYYATSAAGKQVNFSGVTLNDNVVFTIITQKSASSLPATWLGFTAEGVSGNAVLNWKTSEEINVDYYAVEHSTTGRDFTVIATKAANNSLGVNDYAYTHQSLSAGTHYYRIRRVDRDGVYQYSEVKTVKVSGVNAIQVRPNPVAGSTLTLALSMQQKAQTTIQVVSIDGKVMSKLNTQLQQGLNTVSVNVDAIPTGIYLVQIVLADEVVTKKFIRTR
jgi:predicted esterase